MTARLSGRGKPDVPSKFELTDQTREAVDDYLQPRARSLGISCSQAVATASGA